MQCTKNLQVVSLGITDIKQRTLSKRKGMYGLIAE